MARRTGATWRAPVGSSPSAASISVPFPSRNQSTQSPSRNAARVAAPRRAVVIALLASVCAAGAPAAQPVGRETTLDTASEERILALDPEDISAVEVREVLAPAPAPRIIDLQG